MMLGLEALGGSGWEALVCLLLIIAALCDSTCWSGGPRTLQEQGKSKERNLFI